MKKIALFIAIFLPYFACAQVLTQYKDFKFTRFEASIFERAKKEQKPVLLHLRANWCHWCHVMEEETYSDAEVQKYLSENYIYSMEDHDDRADLTALYGEYGWPATLIFNPNGEAIFKQAGYIDKDEFLEILKNFKANFSISGDKPKAIIPEHKSPAQIKLAVAKVENQMLNSLDYNRGGFNSDHKFLDMATMQYAFAHFQNNPKLKNWLQISVENSYALNDKIWGGVYQYSTDGDWEHQHYEKLLNFQADYMKIYLSYYQLFKDEKALALAKNIAKYVKRFLTAPDNQGFYSAQDADLIKGKKADDYYAADENTRLKMGIPTVDNQIYTHSSMQYANALMDLYRSSKEEVYLSEAKNTIDFLLKNRMKNHQMRHAINVSNIQNLNDQTYTILALQKLYQITKNETYQKTAHQILTATMLQFYNQKGGYFNSFHGETAIKAYFNANDNMVMANLLYHGLKEKNLPNTYLPIANKLMDFLTHKTLIKSYGSEADVVNAWEAR